MQRTLPRRPVLTTPDDAQRPAELAARRQRVARQPRLGLAGLLLVVPVAWLLAFAAGGAEASVVALGPVVTFALPAVAMVAFWWEDWPGTALRPAWSGWVDTVLIAVMAVGLTYLGHLVVATRGHEALFPDTLALGGATFAVMLQWTLVTEGWPLRRLPRIPAGLVALAGSWAIAIGLYFWLVEGAFTPPEFGELLTLIAVWQVVFYVVWRGWPFARIRQRWWRLLAGNLVVIGGGLGTFAVLDGTGPEWAATVSAAAGSLVAAGLVVGILFEGAVRPRLVSLAVVVLLGGLLYAGLSWYAGRLPWTRATSEAWVTHAALNAIGVSVILHVAVGKRWPFVVSADNRTQSGAPE